MEYDDGIIIFHYIIIIIIVIIIINPFPLENQYPWFLRFIVMGAMMT